MSAGSCVPPKLGTTAETIVERLTRTRQATLDLLAPLSEADLVAQHSPLMSPLVWDLAHVGNYEDLWLVRALGAPGVRPDLDDLYDAFRHPRRERPSLPILGPDAARTYIDRVRERVLDHLARLAGDERWQHVQRPRCRADLGHARTGAGGVDDLLAGGFVYGMVLQHEHQHRETMLATLQLMAAPGYRPAMATPPRRATARHWPAEVFVPGGPFMMGTSDERWAYDNETPAHTVDVAPFWIDTTAVTNETYVTFVDAGGYDDERWWTPQGWAWRNEAGLRAPQYWRREASAHNATWWRDRFGFIEPLPMDEPVQHVCWYEADACARFLGKRLPTEAEWEKAARHDPSTGRSRRYPWGDDEPGATTANLDGETSTMPRRYGPTPVGSFPAGASACGALGMIGDVWEWTASDFAAYPGTNSFPYREYSEVFYGPDYKVLRGGSWATNPTATRGTFRNWDYPIRRQIFAGFRCARDAD